MGPWFGSVLVPAQNKHGWLWLGLRRLIVRRLGRVRIKAQIVWTAEKRDELKSGRVGNGDEETHKLVEE